MHSSRLAWLLTSLATVSAQTPVNDTCAGAILIANGTAGPFANFNATQGAPPWTCPGNYDVWFLYYAGSPGTLSVDTCGSGLDTVIEIFDGAGGCGALTSLGCNDDSFCAPGSILSVPVVAGPYFIRVGGFGSGWQAYGIFSLHVNGPFGGGAVAWNTPLGAGCGAHYASIYESFDYQSSFDLANTTLTWQCTNSGYVVSRSVGAQIVPATSAAVAVPTQQLFALPAPMPVPGGSVSALNVTRVGQVELGGAAFSSPNGFANPVTLLQQSTSVFACWQDFAFGVGLVSFEIVGGTAYATWNGVSAFGTLGPSTFQFQLDLATGDVRLAIVDVGVPVIAPMECVVGYSPAGYNVDPGEGDLSALTSTVLTAGPEVLPLSLAATTRPRLGTSWDLLVSNVPPSGVVGFDVFGTTDPGIDDLAAIGMPGCGLRSALDVVLTWPNTGSSRSYSLAIPNIASLAGVLIYSTSAVLTNPPENALGIITANGVEGLLGVL